MAIDGKPRTFIDTLRETVRVATETAKTPTTKEWRPRYVDDVEVGQGGMGRIYRVRDTTLLCEVAMKMLEPDSEYDTDRIERFVEEAQITSQLDHPNIVPVHELGTDESGRVFFTMKYVRGVSLHEWLLEPSREIGSSERLADGLEILMKVCDAVSFAHARGVIHRDLKPANIMIGEFGEVYVMDWGLALIRGDVIQTTRDREQNARIERRIGTPAYMAPEAASGRAMECDERTDVFGLGAVLYQIVTGMTPFERDPHQAVQSAKTGTYRPPERFLAGVSISKRILRILERALAKSPDDRYPSAAELKADVRAFLRGGFYLPRQGFPPGAKIVREGESGHLAYVIQSGTCEAYKTIDGERRVLRRMGPGDAFGEMAILCDVPRTATVEAIDYVSAFVVDRASLEEGLGQGTWVGSLVRALAQRFRELDELIAPGIR